MPRKCQVLWRNHIGPTEYPSFIVINKILEAPVFCDTHVFDNIYCDSCSATQAVSIVIRRRVLVAVSFQNKKSHLPSVPDQKSKSFVDRRNRCSRFE